MLAIDNTIYSCSTNKYKFIRTHHGICLLKTTNTNKSKKAVNGDTYYIHGLEENIVKMLVVLQMYRFNTISKSQTDSL